MEKTEAGDLAVLAALFLVAIFVRPRLNASADPVVRPSVEGIKDVGGHDASAEPIEVAR